MKKMDTFRFNQAPKKDYVLHRSVVQAFDDMEPLVKVRRWSDFA